MKRKINFLLILILGVIGSYVYYNREVNIKRPFNTTITVASGENINRAFEKLGINESIFFKIYLKFEKNSGRNIKTGTYNFDGNYSYENIMRTFENGTVGYKKLTIPEGYTVKQIGETLEKMNIGTVAGLYEALKQVDDFPYPTPNGNFEGYLYPNTYFLTLGANEEEVIKTLLNEFLKQFPPNKYKDKKDFYEKLILASIIEKEAQLQDEKPLMASVFYNRLKKGMKLGSDATVNFVYGYTKRRMLYKDLEIDSPYNTYKYKGLPPAPISNPDYNSIMATFKPAKTDYLFFVVTSQGKHTFTKTYKDHLRVQRKKK